MSGYTKRKGDGKFCRITFGRMRYLFCNGVYLGKYQWKERRGEETHELDP